MAVEKVELMDECSHEHFRMGIARLKLDEETEEEGKKRGMKVERNRHEKRPVGLIVQSCLNSSSHVSHSRQSVKKLDTLIGILPEVAVKNILFN